MLLLSLRAGSAALLFAAALAGQAPALQLGPTALGGQMNLVWQGYPTFPAQYSGPLSLPPLGEFHNTRVFTLTTDTRLGSQWDVEFDFEAANGLPLGDATGLAGIANLDVTRDLSPSLAPSVYVARLLAAWRPGHAVLRVGRLDLVDYFDNNAVLDDDHRQFLNWSSDVDAAWDYAADTRGYTNAAELEAGGWQLAYALMPVSPNGMRLNWRSSQIVVQRQIAWRVATVRVLGYATHATLGQYDQAETDIDARHRWRWKQGAEVNAEYALGHGMTVGARVGTENDAIEEYANTECENTISAGLGWLRGPNRLGLAVTTNGLSAAHAAYLARGGAGFLLDDGALTYGRESIAEWYWTRALTRSVSWGPDLQHIANPGYNQARGPVWIGALRLHLGF